MKYRRIYNAGGSYFFTVNIAERSKRLLIEHIDLLREVIKGVKQKHPFYIDAIVILPDHLHTIWTLPTDDSDYATHWMLIKSGFSRQLPRIERRNQSRIDKRERGVWQRRYWEHCIKDDADYANHVDYIHYNPVKHGYVVRSTDWQYSSIHRYIRHGILPATWGSKVIDWL
jgi:putative transposase